MRIRGKKAVLKLAYFSVGSASLLSEGEDFDFVRVPLAGGSLDASFLEEDLGAETRSSAAWESKIRIVSMALARKRKTLKGEKHRVI
jgi:hypothetical protein